MTSPEEEKDGGPPLHQVTVIQRMEVEWNAADRADATIPVETVFRPEYLQALALFARACEDFVKNGYPRPVLVGGGAVEFHTGGAVVSGDFDFVAAARQAFEETLISYGFKREDRAGRLLRGLYHPELGLGAEIVSKPLFDGLSDVHRVQLVEIVDGKAVAIAPIEDLIADRMGQYLSTSNRVPEMLDQAIKLLRLADRLDADYLDKRIRDETHGELGLPDLRELAK
jgi:hypothetical protein